MSSSTLDDLITSTSDAEAGTGECLIGSSIAVLLLLIVLVFIGVVGFMTLARLLILTALLTCFLQSDWSAMPESRAVLEALLDLPHLFPFHQ